jgi:uncharacterized protein (TIGR02444 family)
LVEQAPYNDQDLLQPDNDFWRFSLKVYEQEGVANECLELQERHGVNVNLLLFCAWIGTQAIALDRKDIEAAAQIVVHWDAMVVRPLRIARREMKADPDMATVRARAKALEIEASRSSRRCCLPMHGASGAQAPITEMPSLTMSISMSPWQLTRRCLMTPLLV